MFAYLRGQRTHYLHCELVILISMTSASREENFYTEPSPAPLEPRRPNLFGSTVDSMGPGWVGRWGRTSGLRVWETGGERGGKKTDMGLRGCCCVPTCLLQVSLPRPLATRRGWIGNLQITSLNSVKSKSLEICSCSPQELMSDHMSVSTTLHWEGCIPKSSKGPSSFQSPTPLFSVKQRMSGGGGQCSHR